jgi:uncharacterized protein YndB with AHSA1/START domain
MTAAPSVGNQAGDQARVTVSVAVPPGEAFRIFTEEIDQWWRRGPRFRNTRDGRGERGMLCIEPKVGGRVFESIDTEIDGSAGMGAATRVIEIGQVSVWEPARRLVFSWRASNFAPAESTEVEALFEPAPSGTRLTVTHRGWSALRADHPVRHGQEVPAFIRMMGTWWGELLTSLREHAASGR